MFSLQTEEYIVAEKSDGQRYFLIETINPAEMYIVDRKYRILKVYPKFMLNYKSNKKKNPQAQEKEHKIINIFDGELIVDRH